MSNSPIIRKVMVQNPEGLHARPADLLVQAAGKFKSNIHLGKSAEMVDCKSILSLLMLGATQGTELTLKVDGPDAEKAADRIAALFDSWFDAPKSEVAEGSSAKDSSND